MVHYCGSVICENGSYFCAKQIPFSWACNVSAVATGRGKSCLNQKKWKASQKIRWRPLPAQSQGICQNRHYQRMNYWLLFFSWIHNKTSIFSLLISSINWCKKIKPDEWNALVNFKSFKIHSKFIKIKEILNNIWPKSTTHWWKKAKQPFSNITHRSFKSRKPKPK